VSVAQARSRGEAPPRNGFARNAAAFIAPVHVLPSPCRPTTVTRLSVTLQCIPYIDIFTGAIYDEAGAPRAREDE